MISGSEYEHWENDSITADRPWQSIVMTQCEATELTMKVKPWGELSADERPIEYIEIPRDSKGAESFYIFINLFVLLMRISVAF